VHKDATAPRFACAGTANILNKAGIQQDNRVFGRQKDVAETGGKQAEAKSVEATRAAGNKLTAAQTATAETGLKTKQNLQAKLDELSKLDDTTDPTGEKRRSLQGIILVSLGKDPRADKYQVIDNPTGEKDPVTGKDITNKALFNTRTESFVNAPGSKAAQGVPAGKKQMGTARQTVENMAAQAAGAISGVAGAASGALNARLLEDVIAKRGIPALIGGVSERCVARAGVGAGFGALDGYAPNDYE